MEGVHLEIPDLPKMRTEERGLAVLSHIATMIPIWALVVNAVLYFQYREKSRAVCFHARQGINFQLLFLVILIPLFSLYFLSSLTGVVLTPLMEEESVRAICLRLDQFASLVLAGLFLAYLSCCGIGIVQALRGFVFVYPVAGKQVFQRYVREALGGSE
jgi:uncharacterized Tic20 family protein